MSDSNQSSDQSAIESNLRALLRFAWLQEDCINFINEHYGKSIAEKDGGPLELGPCILDMLQQSNAKLMNHINEVADITCPNGLQFYEKSTELTVKIDYKEHSDNVIKYPEEQNITS